MSENQINLNFEKGSSRGAYVCGECGEDGHNRRTCARNAVPGQRVCRKCCKRKCLSEFPRQPIGREGRHSRCKACITSHRQTRASKDWHSNWHRLRKYGISSDDYEKMLSVQGGVCLVCGGVDGKGKALAVDHSHVSGKIRGLLCGSCNNGLGFFQDSPELCESAAEYLRRAADGNESGLRMA